ncbi:MAG: DUF4397 domain-containing protein [Planctomycetota bacterium]
MSFINASTSSPDLDIFVEDRIEVGGVGFSEATPYSRIDRGRQNVKVVPSGTLQVLIDQNIEVIGGASYSLLLVDNFDAIKMLYLRDDRRAPGANEVRYTFVHAGANLDPVDIYFTTPDIDINTVQPLVQGIPFAGATGYGSVPADFYRLRITTEGTKDLLYDSGPVAFVARKILSLIVLDDPFGPTPIRMMMVDGGATPSSETLLDTRSFVRFVAASPDAPSAKAEIDGDNVANNLSFLESTEYFELLSGDRTLTLRNQTTNSILAEVMSDIEPSAFYTITFSNEVANGIDPLLVLEENSLPIEGNGRIQIIDLAHTVGNAVDVYLVPAGTDIGTRNPTVADVEYQDVLGYFGRNAGNYEIIVTDAGTKNELARSAQIALGDQDIYTALFVEPDPPSTDYGVLVLQDN